MESVSFHIQSRSYLASQMNKKLHYQCQVSGRPYIHKWVQAGLLKNFWLQIKASILQELVNFFCCAVSKRTLPSATLPYNPHDFSTPCSLQQCCSLAISNILSHSPATLALAMSSLFLFSLCSGLLQMPLDFFLSLIHNKNLSPYGMIMSSVSLLCSLTYSFKVGCFLLLLCVL